MADNQAGVPFSSSAEGIDFPRLAKEIVFDHGVQPVNPDAEFKDLYIVWFAFILGGWKALISTSWPDGRYFEVTYNKEKSEAYVDTYRKTHNIAVTIL